MEFRMKSIRSQAGFSFIEVLITAFILATVLMGAVAVQAVAKKSSFEAQQRTVASYLSSDIIERLRLNKTWLQTSLSTASYEVTGIGDGSRSAPACTQSNGGMKDCTGTSLNQHDLFQWEELMSGAFVQVDGNSLPILAEPLACIIIDSTGMAGIMVTWLGRNSEIDMSKAHLAHLGKLSDARLASLLASVSDLSSFSDDCGISDNDRHVYAMVTMIR